MVKEKRILSYTISYLLIGLFICLIGISNVFALEDYEDIGYIDNYTLYYIVAPLNGTETPQQIPQNQEWNLENNVSAFILNIDNYNFDANVNYNIEISMPLSVLTNANTYTVTTSNNKNCNVGLMDLTNPHYPNFTFKCSESTNSIGLKIFNNNNESIVNAGWFRWNYTYLRKLIDKNDEIIKGQEEIKDAIIDSNKETQDVIKDQFNTCRDSYNLFNGNNYTYTNDQNSSLNSKSTNEIVIDSYGTWARMNVNITGLKANTNYIISALIDKSNMSIDVTSGFYINNLWQEKGFLFESQIKGNIYYTFTSSNNGDITIQFFNNFTGNQATGTVKYSNIQIVEGSSLKPFEPYGKICTNKIDDTNDKLDNLQGALTDSSPTDMSGLEDSIGWLPPGPVDSILNLPLALFNSLSNNLSNKTCISVNLKLPFVNQNITLPCVKTLYDKMGITNTLFESTGIIASCFILFNYLLALYKWVDNTLTLRENTMPGYYEDNWGGGA